MRRSLTIAAAAAALAGPAALAQSQGEALAIQVGDPSLQWGPCPAFLPQGCEIAVLQGDPAKPHADIFFRVPGGAEIARHWHTSPERMVLVTGEMEVAYDGQEPITLNPGQYAYGPPMKPHSANCLSSDPCTLFIAFIDPLDAFPGAPD